MKGWFHSYVWLIPIVLVAIAAASLALRAESDVCVLQDPVRVQVGDTVYAIPAVMLPYLYLDKGMVPVVRQNSVDGKVGYSRAGSRLARWYCESKDGAPIAVQSFSVHDEHIANAVKLGELDYSFLPHAGVISIRSGTYRSWPDAEDMAPESSSGLFQIHCAAPHTWSVSLHGLRTSTLCTAQAAASPDNVMAVKFYIEEREGQPTINGREDWPEIAREVEHLVRSMQLPVD